MRALKYTITLVIMLVLATGNAAAEDMNAAVTAAATAKVLQLEDGRLVRLAAIQAPNIARDANEDDDVLAAEAHAAMKTLAVGKTLRFTPVGKGLDRRGRTVAMAYDDDTWLQAEMLRQGMAWVYTFADSRPFAADLLAAEREAEAAQRGVWSKREYAVLTPENAAEHAGEFRLVRGTVREIAEVHGRYYLNFGEDWKTDFTLLIDRDDAKNFDYDWLQTLPGKSIRARGWLFSKNGPAIALSHPEQLEILHENVTASIDPIGRELR